MPESDTNATTQAPAAEKNKYAHVLDLARAKKASRGELEPERRLPHPPSAWTPPPTGE